MSMSELAPSVSNPPNLDDYDERNLEDTEASIRATLRATLRAILQKPQYGILRVRLFGSFARHSARPGSDPDPSDVDIVVEFPRGKTLFDLIRLQHELEDALQWPVDVLTYEEIERAHPRFRSSVLADQEEIPLR